MIYINLKTNRLIFRYRYAKSDLIRKRMFPIASGGQDEPRLTPMGKFHVVRKIIYPKRYYPDITHAEAAQCEPGVLELNVRYLNRPYAIHGCDPDVPLVNQTSQGCIRMLDDDLIELFNVVEKGFPVVIWGTSFADASLDDIPDYNRIRNWPPIDGYWQMDKSGEMGYVSE